MKRTPLFFSATPREYVEQLTLRSPKARREYLSRLDAFQSFVIKHGNGKGVSEKLIQNRALVSPNSRSALMAIRPAPRFGSFLGSCMRQYLTLMRAMGHRYDSCEKHLLQFDRFLQTRPDLAELPLAVLIREWAKLVPTPNHALRCQIVGRVLSKALSRVDPRNPGIVWSSRVQREAYQCHRRPYIFNDGEIRRIFEAARMLPSARSPLRAQAAYAMAVLAYCAGLRVGEIARLSLNDFDLTTDTIQIHETKFFKTRHLPLSRTAAAALRSYIQARRGAGAPADPSSGLFWHRSNRCSGRYGQAQVSALLAEAFRRAGLKPKRGKMGPRPHDLRQHPASRIMPNLFRMHRLEGFGPCSDSA